MDGPGGYHPEWGNPITKEVTWYALTDKWILAQKPRIAMIQLPKHKKIKKKEDQCVDTSFLPRIGNKISMEGVAETKFWAKPNGWTIQRLLHPEVHPIIGHQTQTPLHMSTRFCSKDPDIDVSCEFLPVPGKYRRGCSQSCIGWNTGPTMEELEKFPRIWRGLQPYRWNNNMNLPVPQSSCL